MTANVNVPKARSSIPAAHRQMPEAHRSRPTLNTMGEGKNKPRGDDAYTHIPHGTSTGKPGSTKRGK